MGILNKKLQIIDFCLTREGKQKLLEGKLNLKYFSLQDQIQNYDFLISSSLKTQAEIEQEFESTKHYEIWKYNKIADVLNREIITFEAIDNKFSDITKNVHNSESEILDTYLFDNYNNSDDRIKATIKIDDSIASSFVTYLQERTDLKNLIKDLLQNNNTETEASLLYDYLMIVSNNFKFKTEQINFNFVNKNDLILTMQVNNNNDKQEYLIKIYTYDSDDINNNNKYLEENDFLRYTKTEMLTDSTVLDNDNTDFSSDYILADDSQLYIFSLLYTLNENNYGEFLKSIYDKLKNRTCFDFTNKEIVTKEINTILKQTTNNLTSIFEKFVDNDMLKEDNMCESPFEVSSAFRIASGITTARSQSLITPQTSVNVSITSQNINNRNLK